MIIMMTGAADAAEFFASSIRNSQIGAGCGALLLRKGEVGAPQHLIEKILVGVQCPTPKEGETLDLSKLPWKPNAVVVVLPGGEEVLEACEARLPGFKEALGPVRTMGGGDDLAGDLKASKKKKG